MITDGVDGYLIAPNDIDALTHAMVEPFTNPEKREDPDLFRSGDQSLRHRIRKYQFPCAPIDLERLTDLETWQRWILNGSLNR